MEKHSTFSAFNFISLFSFCNSFCHPYFMLSSLFLFPSLCFVEHRSLSQTQSISLCVVFLYACYFCYFILGLLSVSYHSSLWGTLFPSIFCLVYFVSCITWCFLDWIFIFPCKTNCISLISSTISPPLIYYIDFTDFGGTGMDERIIQFGRDQKPDSTKW